MVKVRKNMVNRTQLQKRIADINSALEDLRTERERAFMAWYAAGQGTPKNNALRTYYGVLGAIRELTVERIKTNRMMVFG